MIVLKGPKIETQKSHGNFERLEVFHGAKGFGADARVLLPGAEIPMRISPQKITH